MRTTVKLGWTRPDTEEEFTLKCSVSGGCRATRTDPAEEPEVEVLTVTDEDGNSRPDLVDEAQASIDPGLVIEEAQEWIESARLDHYDRERKSRLEDRL